MNIENLNIADSIAIIGMDGRFPGAKNIDEFWDNLKNSRESITHFTDDQLLNIGIDKTVIDNTNYVKAGAFLEDIDLFDADFFGYNPKEASAIDPQHRIFLECAYSALENAGYNPDKYAGKIGIFAGVGWNNYLLFNLNPDEDFFQTALGYQTVIGNEKDFLTTRISYLLNLKGISLNLQTGCSTSLVATSMACQSLLTYQSDMALAGGVSIASLKKTGYLYQEGGILSPDGHCRAFDAQAQGTVPGSGVGVVVLKRLEDAMADGDYIQAIIRGSAINNDGSGKIGYTAPSIDGQAEVIAEALALAEVEPETISYIETHGTGTALGDPIEIAALNQIFQAGTTPKKYCALGSVKTNIGHLDAAAGITGLIKTVLALKHQQIPPSLHFQQPNPKINFANSPFYVNTELKEWKTPGYPRRAGVSSFGIGGTNAHVVLEEAPVEETGRLGVLKDLSRIVGDTASHNWKTGSKSNLLVISAKTESALETATNNLIEHLNKHPELNLADVAYTLKVGRKEFAYRRMVVGKNLEDVAIALQNREPQRVLTHCTQLNNHSIVFMFPGQGSQYVNMGKELYETEPVFREWIDRCSELLEPELGLDLRSLIYPKNSELEIATNKLKQTQIAQPAIFTIEYALAQLWMSWGIKPQTAIGHSIGEYVAATIAGVFSLEDALILVARRGKLIQQMPTGSMLAVSLSDTEVKELLTDGLSLAAINAPNLCVISGSDESIAKINEELTEKGIECRHLHTSHAFHSAMMDGAIAGSVAKPIAPFTQEIAKVKLNPPQMPFISNVSGTWITDEEATNPHYWAKHMRQTVRFADGVSQLLQEQENILLEVGAGRTLSTFVKRNSAQAAGQIVLSSLPHPKETVDDRTFILNMLGRLWLAGVAIDWSNFYAHQKRHRVPLPTYPFERQRYWIDPVDPPLIPPLKGKKDNIADWFYVPAWKALPLIKTSKITNDRYLVFVDQSAISDRLIEKLRQDGQNAIAVYIGDNFSQDHHGYTINPNNPEDYQTLFQAISELGNIPTKIIYLWNTSPSYAKRYPLGLPVSLSPSPLVTQSFWHLIYLAQAIEQPKHNIEIIVATNNLYDVIGDETLSYKEAT
ncbi:MAG: type I polyketide synthase, partial [Waterburya sp.]